MRNLVKRDAPTPEPASLVILADTSGSMRGDKINRLRRELLAVWPDVPGARLLSFDSDLRWLDGPGDLPAPGGGTDLKGALVAAATVWPGEVLVISDGRPDDEQGALEAARKVPGTISVLFVGSDDDHGGAEFLRRLATLGGGMYAHRDLAKHMALEGEIRGMLALPPPLAMGGPS